jgi:CRP-like cAMP-binding protein
MKRLTKESGLKLLSMIDVIEVAAHKQVFLQGDKNDFVYIVFQGEVDIFLQSNSEKRLTSNYIRSIFPDGPTTDEEKKIYGEHISRMKCGQIFGDFYDDTSNNTRSASVICNHEDCSLLRISKDAYVDNFIMNASMSYSSENWMPILQRDSADRTVNDMQLLMHMATSVPLLQRFPRINRETILREMTCAIMSIRRFGEKPELLLPNFAVIIEEGPIVEEDPAMFWVLQGNVQVRSLKTQSKCTTCSPFADVNQTQLEEALNATFGTLDFIVREGRIIGESILRTDALSSTRTASVIAVGSVILGVIKKHVCQPCVQQQQSLWMNSEIRHSILTKFPPDRTTNDIQLLSEMCSQSSVLQHLPKYASDSLLREAYGMQLNTNEVVYIQNSKPHFFAILLEGSLTSHELKFDPQPKIQELDLFDKTTDKRRILSSLIAPISSVRVSRVCLNHYVLSNISDLF